jgi:hypothetical protein
MSIWSDIEKRSAGETVRKEDEVNIRDFWDQMFESLHIPKEYLENMFN